MKPLLALVFASAAFGSTIPVTGLGTFSMDNFQDSYANVCFSGSDGQGSVSVCANGVPIGPAPPSNLWGSSANTPPMSFSSATVDGITSNNYELALGFGDDFLEILDDQRGVLAREEISGDIDITGYQEFGGSRFLSSGYINTNWAATGTFAIVQPDGLFANAAVTQAPEAGSMVLVGIGLLAVALGSAQRHY